VTFKILGSYTIFPPDIASITNFFHDQERTSLSFSLERSSELRITIIRAIQRGGYSLQKWSALPSTHPR
jgi:hypothetical protein